MPKGPRGGKKPGSHRRRTPSRSKVKKSDAVYPVRAETGDQKAITERIPELYPLREKKIAIAGLGCIGAPSVLEFAKCGVGELRLLDKDDLSPGNICRWPLGLPHVGTPKTELLRWFVEANYPLTKVTIEHYPTNSKGDAFLPGFEIGMPDLRYNEWECLEKFIDGADLIFDATTEDGVNHLLSDLARHRDIPYIYLSTRHGGWGGEIGRIIPGVTEGCYICHHLNKEDDPRLTPPYKEGDFVQPFGCGDPTFTAASFDVTEVSLTAVRVAVSTLCEGYDDSYPAIEGDIAILHLRDLETGKAIHPRWEVFPLLKNPKCCPSKK